MEKDTPFMRLLHLLDSYLKEDPRHTPSSFEKEYGLANGYFHNADKQGNSYEKKVLYAKTYANIRRMKPLLNMNWLETGRGEIWLKERPSADSIQSTAQDELKRRPYFKFDFAEGIDGLIASGAKDAVSYISMEPYNRDECYWCNFSGNSMYPLIKSGSKMCIRSIKEGVNGIVYGEVYAIVAKPDLRTVRWVVRSDDENKIRLVPENKEPKYGDYIDILKTDVRQVFKVEFAGCAI